MGIRNEEHLNRVIRYIELNPVNARLVGEPHEWTSSSAGRREGL